MNGLVSIIVPVYNSENTIKKCIDSLIDQSYQNIEIIIINDGSVDNSVNIIKRYLDVDERIKLFTIENAGVSNARNSGLKYATGEYVVFCDSDDYVTENYIKDLISHIDDEIDLVISNYYFDINSKICPKPLVLEGLYSKTNNIQEWINNFFLHHYIHSPYCKIYKKEIIDKYNLIYDVSMTFGEDFKFNLDYFQYCKKVFITSNYTYYYVQNSESLSNKFSENKLRSFINIYQIYAAFLKKNNLEYVLNSTYTEQLVQDYITLVKQICICKNIDSKEKMKYFKMIKIFLNQYVEIDKVFKNSTMSNTKLYIIKNLNYYYMWKLIFSLKKYIYVGK